MSGIRATPRHDVKKPGREAGLFMDSQGLARSDGSREEPESAA
jgi:hypothetical protein